MPKLRMSKLTTASYLSYDREQMVDFAEFTKSDREKATEILFDWRTRHGWSQSRSSARSFSWRFFAFLFLPQFMIVTLSKDLPRAMGKRLLQFWFLIHTLIIAALIRFLIV